MGVAFRTKAAILALCAAGVVGCGLAARAAEEPPHPQALDDAIIAAAKRHGVPEHLVRRIIMRESKYNARARNRVYWGLMQISYPTAKSMGFKGTPQQLLNPFVNLRYAVPYLANAYKIAGKTEDAAVRLYAAGYYFTAKSRGLLSELRTADSAPLAPEASETPMLAANAVAQPPQSVGVFGALFGPGSQPQPQPAAYVAQAQPGADPQQAQAGSPAAPPAPASTQTAAAAPPGTFDGKTVEMSPNKAGEMAPPKKWSHDGGMTVMARGEQGLDQVASRDRQPEDEPRRSARHHHQKTTNFAALDVPSTTAQAYANQPGADPRFTASAPQEAIAQATAGAPAPGTAAPVAMGAQPQAAADGAQPAAPPATDATSAADAPAKKHVRRHVARHRKATEARTQQASAEKSEPDTASPPAAAPAPQPVQ